MRTFNKTAFAAVCLLALLGSCKKETPLNVSGSPLSGDVQLFQTDTLSITTETISEQPLLNGKVLSGALFGAYNDPFFGITRADFYTDFDLKENNLSFGTAPVLDSVVLSLSFSNENAPYGNVNSPMVIKVYQLNQRPEDGGSYYSDKTLAYMPTEIGSYSGIINHKDSVPLFLDGKTSNYDPHIRIRLSNTFGSHLLNAPASAYADKESFRNFMNGVLVRAENPSEGAIFKFAPVSAWTKITVFYNHGERKEFLVGENGNWFNNYSHNYSGSLVSGRYNDGRNADTCFIQSLSGLKLKIKLPSVAWMAENNLAINEARLTLPVLAGSAGTYTPVPSRLLLVKRGTDGRNDFILDQLYEADKYGGYYNSADRSYTFSLVRHLQDIIKKYKSTGTLQDPDLYVIIPSDNPLTASRVLIDTRKNNRLKLKLTYTNL